MNNTEEYNNDDFVDSENGRDYDDADILDTPLEAFPVSTESVLDSREREELDKLTFRYKKMTEPGALQKALKSANNLIPDAAKDLLSSAASNIQQQKIYLDVVKTVGDIFTKVEENASKFSLNHEKVLWELAPIVNADDSPYDFQLSHYSQIAQLRSYDIEQAVRKYKNKDLALAATEGAATGVAGFAGLPANIVASTFIYFRAVQSIALLYGYDVKNDPDELEIAHEVFIQSLSPRSTVSASKMGSYINKIMIISELAVTRETVKKGYEAMIKQGGISLLLAQIRGLAHKSAAKALQKAGTKGLEENFFKNALHMLGKNLSQKAIGKAIPAISAFISGALDTAQMNTVIDFAAIFYHKRFLLEKEHRIEKLKNNEYTLPDVEIDIQSPPPTVVDKVVDTAAKTTAAAIHATEKVKKAPQFFDKVTQSFTQKLNEQRSSQDHAHE